MRVKGLMDKRNKSRKILTVVFAVTLVIIAGVFISSFISTYIYNSRVHTLSLSGEDIIKEIERNKGTQFDPKIADVFLKLMKSGKV